MTKIRFLIIAVILIVLVGGLLVAKADTLTEDYKARLTGHGVLNILGMDVIIAGIRTKDGSVQGTSVTPKNFNGKVMEVVPFGGYWCVNVSIDESYSWIWFIKDIVGGVDQLAWTDGPSSLNCSNVPVPAFFVPIDSGDFKTELKTF